MLKNIIIGSLTTFTLLMSGCGNSDGESKLETQQMLDNGDYQGVINKIEATANSKSDYMLLASAYMGKAGYSILDIVNALSDSGDNSNLISSLGSSGSFKSTLDLKKAKLYYKKIVDENICSPDANITISNSQKDVCLFLGLTAVSEVASTVTLLVGDLDSFGSNDFNASTDYKLQASGCAMRYAFENNLTTRDVDTCHVVVAPADINFTVTNKQYRPITVTVRDENNNTVQNNGTDELFYYLLSQENNVTHVRQTVITSGYCSVDSFTPRKDEYEQGLYACPINEERDAPEATSMDVLVDALNGGLDAVIAATQSTGASGDNSSDQDIQSSVDEFKCEVLGGVYHENNSDAEKCQIENTNTNIDVNQDVNQSQIIDYLNSQNN